MGGYRELVCPKCGSHEMIVQNGVYDILQCANCGHAFLVEQSDGVTRAKLKIQKDKENVSSTEQFYLDEVAKTKRCGRVCASILGILGLMLAFLAITRSEIPLSEKEVANRSISDVASAFEDAGFCNIVPVALGDLWDGFLHDGSGDNGKVKNVTVNGEALGEHKSAWKHSVVRIYYHSYPE